MELDDLDIDIKIEVTSIEELREVRKELQKIARSKKEIEINEDGEDDGLDKTDPLDISEPDKLRRPHFFDYPDRKSYFISDKTAEGSDSSTFSASTEITMEEIEGAAESIETQGMTDEEFHAVNNLDEGKFDGGHL